MPSQRHGTTTATEIYGYDDASNLINKSGTVQGYSASTRRLCAVGASACSGAFIYDEAGNLTTNSGTGFGISYTPFNLLEQITKSATTGNLTQSTLTYTYDAAHTRVKESIDAGVSAGSVTFFASPCGFEEWFTPKSVTGTRDRVQFKVSLAIP